MLFICLYQMNANIASEIGMLLYAVDKPLIHNVHHTCVLSSGNSLWSCHFRLSMIAPVKKSVNHSRTVASMHKMGWEQQQKEVCLRGDSTVQWSEFAFAPVGHCFLCCNQFLSAVIVELTFSFLLVLHSSLHAAYYARNETSEHWL